MAFIYRPRGFFSPTLPPPETYVPPNELIPILGRSPRTVTHFVNVYRILRSSLKQEEHDPFFKGGAESEVEYPVVLLLLSILNGSPSLATYFFKSITESADEESFEAFIASLKKEHALEKEDGKESKKEEWYGFLQELDSLTKDSADDGDSETARYKCYTMAPFRK